MPRKEPDKSYRATPVRRRDLLRTAAATGVVAAGAGYASFAPEHWPLSLRDDSGLRSVPQPSVFTLPDYRVAPKDGAAQVGLGRTGDDMTRLRKAIDAVGGITHYIKPHDVVLIKPNVAFDRSPIIGATSNPEILEHLIQLILVDCRAAEVRVADNPIESPADCFEKSGIRLATERSGGRIYLPDGNAFENLNTPGATLIESWPFFKRPFQGVDKVIGISPVKDHNLCHASMSIKNWYGLLGGRRNQFHQDIHEIIADLSMMIKPTLSILDGTHVLMENGPTGGDPANVKNAGVIMAGTDAVAMDAWAYEHLLERTGLPEYLNRAQSRGSGDVNYTDRIREIV